MKIQNNSDDEKLAKLRDLLKRGCFFPDARDLAILMISILERKKRNLMTNGLRNNFNLLS